MHSRHLFIGALMLGAWALIFVLGAFLALELLDTATPYIPAREKPVKGDPEVAPKFITQTTSTAIEILQVDADGAPVKLVYSSDLKDNVADFELFAVPQTKYAGKIYLQSTQDAAGTALIVYPLDLATSNISPAVLNLPRQHASLSPNQDRVAVINSLPSRNLSAYDLASGQILASWTLEANEFLNDNKSARYTGPGAMWTSNNCFDHSVWTPAGLELRSFCLETPAESEGSQN